MPSSRLEIATRGRGLVEITAEVEDAVRTSGVREGMVLVYLRHTSASLVVQENADPTAARDLEAFFERIAPEGDPRYRHTAEGPDDMPSHLRAALTRTSEAFPILDGRMARGTWQGLFLFEHRRAPHRRTLDLMILSGD